MFDVDLLFVVPQIERHFCFGCLAFTVGVDGAGSRRSGLEHPGFTDWGCSLKLSGFRLSGLELRDRGLGISGLELRDWD